MGCEDLYNYGDFPAEGDGARGQRLDLMAQDEPLRRTSPCPTACAWAGSTPWIDVFDFGANPNGRAVTLQAAETLARNGPPPGRKAGIEIHVRDGWNYYFEYRRTQAGQVGDQRLNLVRQPGSWWWART